jgi:hypothetical protein
MSITSGPAVGEWIGSSIALAVDGQLGGFVVSAMGVLPSHSLRGGHGRRAGRAFVLGRGSAGSPGLAPSAAAHPQPGEVSSRPSTSIMSKTLGVTGAPASAARRGRPACRTWCPVASAKGVQTASRSSRVQLAFAGAASIPSIPRDTSSSALAAFSSGQPIGRSAAQMRLFKEFRKVFARSLRQYIARQQPVACAGQGGRPGRGQKGLDFGSSAASSAAAMCWPTGFRAS